MLVKEFKKGGCLKLIDAINDKFVVKTIDTKGKVLSYKEFDSLLEAMDLYKAI